MRPQFPPSGNAPATPPAIPASMLSPFEQTELQYLSRIASRLDDLLWVLMFIAAMTAASAWLLFTVR